MSWIFDNKEWLFSGLGISAVTLLVWLYNRRHSKDANQTKADVQPGNVVVVDRDAHVSGQIAGRDLNIFKVSLPAPSPSLSIERYRGSLMAKFKSVYDNLDATIDAMKAPENSLAREEIEYLVTFRSKVSDIEGRVFKALDEDNLVVAHEILSELRRIALKAIDEVEEHHRGFEMYAMLSPMDMWAHGSQRDLRLRALDALLPMFQQEEP